MTAHKNYPGMRPAEFLLPALVTLAALLLTTWPASAATGGHWQVYLYGNGVRGLAADGESVWGATNGGAFRFSHADAAFEQWNRAAGALLSDSVTAAAVDASGRVWFGTERAGISVFDPDRLRWRAFTSLLESIPGDQIQRIRFGGTAAVESLLVAARQGYALFVNEELRDVCLEGIDLCGLGSFDVRDLMGRNGDMWMATAAGVSVHTSAGEWVNRSAGLSGQGVRVLARADSLYAAGPGGIWTWRGDEWGLAAGYDTQLPGSFSCTDMIVDGADLLVSGVGGVFRRSEGNWIRVGSGGPAGNVTSLAMTDSGRLFAGAMDPYESSDGLWEFDGSVWTQHRTKGPSQRMDLLSLAFDSEGALWFSSRRSQEWVAAVTRFRDGVWDVFNAGQEGRLNSWTYNIREVGGAVWLAHCCCTGPEPPLCRMEKVTGDGSVFEALPVFNAWTLDNDSRGYLWAGSSGASIDDAHGLYRIDPTGGEILQFTPDDQPEMVTSIVRAVRVIGRHVWIGYAAEGVSRWDLGPDMEPGTEDDDWTLFVQGIAPLELLGGDIKCIEPAPDGKVWIGSTAGISIYDGVRFIKVGAGFGRLPTPDVNAIVPTVDGGAWVATSEGGLTRMTPRALGGFTYETVGPPYLPNPNIVAMRLGPDGRTLWMATSRGLASFRPMAAHAATGGEIGAAPNPYFPACGGGLRLVNPGGAASGVIVDLSGRVVHRFESSEVDASGFSGVVWDGKIQGVPATPGLYWIRARTPIGVESIGVAVMDGSCPR